MNAFIDIAQKDGSKLKTEEIIKLINKTVAESGCESRVPQELIEEYAVCTARWIQCEENNNKFGLLTKIPISQKPIISPYINAGMLYLNQSIKLRNEINSIIQKFGKIKFEPCDPVTQLLEERNADENNN